MYKSQSDFLVGGGDQHLGNRLFFHHIRTIMPHYVTCKPTEQKRVVRYCALMEFPGRIWFTRKGAGWFRVEEMDKASAANNPLVTRVFQKQGQNYKKIIQKVKKTDEASRATVSLTSRTQAAVHRTVMQQKDYAKLYSEIYLSSPKKTQYLDSSDDTQEDEDPDWSEKSQIKVNKTIKAIENEMTATGWTGCSFASWPRVHCLGHSLPLLQSSSTIRFHDMKYNYFLVGIIRQVLYKQDSGKFLYLIQNLHGVVPIFHREFLEDALIALARNGLATLLEPPDLEKSKSSGQTDVYTDNEGVDWGAFSPFPRRYYPTKSQWFLAFDHYSQNHLKNPVFRCKINCLLKDLATVVREIPIAEQPDRLSWKNWTTVAVGHRWHIAQIAMLCQLTSKVNDANVKVCLQGLFHKTSARLGCGEKFDNPVSVCRDPETVFQLITMKGETAKLQGMGKGVNYCNKKAADLIRMCKQLVVMSHGRQVKQDPVSLINHYVKGQNVKTALPDWMLEKCLSSGDSCFPTLYNDEWTNNLPGIGVKMRHLLAEAGYGLNYGPALDCHMTRFVVAFCVCPAKSSDETMSCEIKEIVQDDLYPSLNEVPATIAQILGVPRLRIRSEQFIEKIKRVARDHGFLPHMLAFLRHYPVSSKKD